MIHVVLLTCERFDYTNITARSFLRHNSGAIEAGRLALWHADDASTDERIRSYAARAGFRELVYTRERVGVTDMVRRIARRLAHLEAEWLLLLENDWETVRGLPWPVIEAATAPGSGIWALRLYGAYKGRSGTIPAGTRHRGRNGADPCWEELTAGGERYQVGSIHWGNPPTIARVAEVEWLHKSAKREKDAILKSGEIGAKVARVIENVVYHVGEDRTPGFRS